MTDGPEAGSGIDGLIERTEPFVDEWIAGLTTKATIVFPLARQDVDVSEGRRYSLWMGRVVGEALVSTLD